MRARHDRRRDAQDHPDRGAVTAPPDAAARLLALQRTAGNAAVAGLLQTKQKIQPPRQGGWNEQAQEVAGTVRIPVSGVKAGQQLDDPQFGQTTESAAAWAVVIVPRGLDLRRKADVLLFFHGMGNVGYRERTTDHTTRGKEGTVHDVEVDRIPQQLAAAGGQTIGVLPQGINRAKFGIADPQAYVDEVLALATPAYQQAAKAQGTLQAGRIVVAGHSGGGRAAFAATKALESGATADAWAASPPLVLFDGINGTAELKAVAGWAERWLDADLAMLRAAPDPAALLARRRLKLLSTYTAGGRYQALNAHGTYVDDAGNTVTIAPEQGLRGRIKRWFDRHRVDPAYAADLKAQYLVEGPVAGGHEQTVGTGRSPEAEKSRRLPAPAGLTGPSKAAGVPDYGGGGNLEKALKKVQTPRPSPRAELELPGEPLPVG